MQGSVEVRGASKAQSEVETQGASRANQNRCSRFLYNG